MFWIHRRLQCLDGTLLSGRRPLGVPHLRRGLVGVSSNARAKPATEWPAASVSMRGRLTLAWVGTAAVLLRCRTPSTSLDASAGAVKGIRASRHAANTKSGNTAGLATTSRRPPMVAAMFFTLYPALRRCPP